MAVAGVVILPLLLEGQQFQHTAIPWGEKVALEVRNDITTEWHSLLWCFSLPLILPDFR